MKPCSAALVRCRASGSAKVGGERGIAEDLLHAINNGKGKRQQLNVARRAVSIKPLENHLNGVDSGRDLTRLAMACGIKFSPSMQGTNDFIRTGGASSYFTGARLWKVKFAKVGDIKVKCSHRASRSSEIMTVESVPPERAPESQRASYSGEGFRFDQ